MDNYGNFDNYNGDGNNMPYGGNNYGGNDGNYGGNDGNYGGNNYGGNNYGGNNYGGYNQGYQPVGDPTVSVLGWIGYMILFCIPCVGLIACIVLAFSASNNNVKNFARAELIIIIACIVICLLLSLILGASMATLFNSYSY